jgi:riboflavin kinase/FMN adenylyltransferase
LTPLPRKLAILEQLGVDGVWVLPFSRDLSRTEPDAFIDRVCRTLPTLRQLVVGPDWRFGRNAGGGASELRLLAGQYGFEPVISKPFLVDGVRVSSTLIRQAVQAGEFEKAQTLLGRPYTLTGQVIHGRQVGRKLGFPTANILPDQVVLPPHGVYAVETEIAGEPYGGAGYYGHRSVDPEENQTYFVEVYLFDFDRDIYGQSIGIRLLSYIRPDQRFDSYDALVAQIQRDTKAIRLILARRPW